MRIRMLTGLAGEGRQPGEVLDLPANEAQALLTADRAELVTETRIETPERVVRDRAVTKQQGKARETRGQS